MDWARRILGFPSRVQIWSPYRTERLQILPGFWDELFPVLVLLWTGVILAYLILGWDYLWTLLPWATVTTIMLWPVGGALGDHYLLFKGVPYLSYRTVGFIIGVLSMALIPFSGFALKSDLPFGVRSAVFFGMIIGITTLGILPGLRRNIGPPIGMFFRPDLLFGDGRVLAMGFISLVVGLRYIIGGPAMDVPWPLPKWDWYAIFFVIVAGLIPLIALRGVLKLFMRMRRMRDKAWTGWWAVLIREGICVLTFLSIGYGFHAAFMGVSPFTVPILTGHPHFWPALGITLAGACWLIFVRGAYKKYVIGDPFIRETTDMAIAKHVLLVVGILVLVYGFMSLLSLDPMHTEMGIGGLRSFSNTAQIWPIGLPFILWGVILLVPVRAFVQHNQRHAIVAQMAAIILPWQRPEPRQRAVRRMIRDGLLEVPPGYRWDYQVTINRALADMPPEDRVAVTRSMVSVIADLPAEQRNTMIESQATALGLCPPRVRIIRMTDMMTAVAELPEEKRQPIMEKMATLLM